MNSENFLLIMAVVAVIVSIAAAGVTYFSVANLVTKISGYATSSGVANLTVETSAVINFTTNTIFWGSGRVTPTQTSATLDTAAGTVTNGNWTAVTSGFAIQNIGNVNVSLVLAAGKTNATFIGGTTPGYFWNITNVEAQSCRNVSYTPLWTWLQTNTTMGICDQFIYTDSNDSIRVDIRLTVPYDSTQGLLTDTITATATAV